MKTKSIILILFISLTILNCKSKPSYENLTKILNAKKSTIKLINSHGSIVGTANRSESKEKFEITNDNNEIKIKYFKSAYHSDSIFIFDLSSNEVDSLIMILKQSVKTHNPNKEYGGCCMCSNIDFYLFNDNIKMEVKPSEEIEYLFYDLTEKYGKVLMKKQKEYYNKESQIENDFEISQINDEFGRRNYIDSLNFSIVRGWFDNGNLFIEHITNLDTKIESSKEYYENGKLKQKGLMIYANHNYIGLWKYYSENGELDSIVDYDKKQPISYYKALEIAEKKGFVMPEIEVEKTYSKEKMFWQINRWTENKNESGQTAEIILIDSQTGKVSKPEYQLMSIY